MAVSHVFSNAIADFTGTITGFNSQGSTTTIAATNLVRPSNWNSAHNQFYTLTGNTTGNTTASATNVLFAGSGGISVGGSTATVVFSVAPQVTISSFQNIPLIGASTSASFNANTISHCVSFQLPETISVSFIRIPASYTNNETTRATTAATLSASVQMQSTWNAAVYSLGTGANSQSLVLVASGSGSELYLNQINVAANGTQYSATQSWVRLVEGGTTSSSTQYSISNTNLSFSSGGMLTRISGLRYVDIPFANSLSAGPYWLVFGLSTTTTANSTGMSAMSNCNAPFSYYFPASQFSINVGVMNTALTIPLGAGSFGTAGGGTTTSFPYTNISTSASNNMPMFQMIRSA